MHNPRICWDYSAYRFPWRNIKEAKQLCKTLGTDKWKHRNPHVQSDDPIFLLPKYGEWFFNGSTKFCLELTMQISLTSLGSNETFPFFNQLPQKFSFELTMQILLTSFVSNQTFPFCTLETSLQTASAKKPYSLTSTSLTDRFSQNLVAWTLLFQMQYYPLA